MASQQQQHRQGQRQRAPLSNGHAGPSTAVVYPEQQGRTVGSPGAYARDGRVNGYYRQHDEHQYQHGYAGSDNGNNGELQNGEEEERDHFRDMDGDGAGARELQEQDGDGEQQEQEQDAPAQQPQLSRHGFESPEEVLRELESRYFLYYTDTRHVNAGRAKPLPYSSPPDWRAKDKVKIVHGALVVCLRIGFDPPDVVKTSPCARMEAWVDTTTVGKDRAMESISTNLTKQFESLALSSKAKFSTYLDPAHEDLRKLCVGLRRKTRNDRALFHYNGHGVPRPTPSGEIWVFNRQYTQYIPVNVADIVGYLGGPSVYLWDCSNAGNIVNKILELQKLPEGKFPAFSATTAPPPPATSGPGGPATSSKDSTGAAGTPTEGQANAGMPSVTIASIQDIIQLAACQAHESLPMNPDLPADLFTSCITSPIEMSIRFFLLHNPLRSELKLELGAKIPGKLSDRKTPLGELIWIFTSVTDTIAWNMVPRHLFQRLFRHDLVLAAIFRGFLLAERIMRRYNCTPLSVPALPACHNHPLWDSWDLALDRCLSQIPALKRYEDEKQRAEEAGEQALIPPVTYSHSYFFADHLSAFSVWIDQGTARTTDAAQLYNERGVVLKSGHRRTLPPQYVKEGKGPIFPPTVTVTVNGEAEASSAKDLPKLQTGSQSSRSRQAGSSSAQQAADRRRTKEGGHAVNGTNGHEPGSSPTTTLTTTQKGSIPVTVAQLKRNHKTLRVAAEQPEHLPILLQVLLSQVHRLRALMLLCKFLDLGPWAVNLSLSIGIFPYVLKLLQAPGPELRPVLVYIWARILAIYRLCQEDLAKAAGLPNARNGGKPELPIHYFAALLDPQSVMLVIPNVSEHRAMCCFILSIFMRDYPYAQQLCLTSVPANARMNVFESCLFHIHDDDPLLRQWSALTIAILWDDLDEAKGFGVKLKALSDFTTKLHAETVPEVRSALLFAIGVFIGNTAGDILTGKGNAGRAFSACATERTGLSEQWQADEELGVTMATLKVQSDGSPLVRKELVILLSGVVRNHRGSFAVAAYDHIVDRRDGVRHDPAEVFEERMAIMEQSLKYRDPVRTGVSTYTHEFRAIMFACMYKVLLDLAGDPFPDVSERAVLVVDYIHTHLLNSDLPLSNLHSSESASGEDSDDDGHHRASEHDDSGNHSSAASRREASTGTTASGPSTAGTAATAVSHEAGPVEEVQAKPSLFRYFRGLAKMGLADLHAPRHPQAGRGEQRPASVRAADSRAPTPSGSRPAIPSSRSVAYMGDSAAVSRALRHVSSADSLRRRGQDQIKHSRTHTESSRESGGAPSSRSGSASRTPSIAPSVQEAKDALFRADAERQRRARQTPAPVVVTPARVAPTVPLAPNPADAPPPAPAYAPSPTVSDENGKPTSSEMPLRSEFFDWSAEYFISPQMKEKEADEPGSVEYSERHWRRERNEKVILATQPLKELAGQSRWDQLDAEFDNTNTPEIIDFHQFEPHLASADAYGNIRIYHWQERRAINRFSNVTVSDERFQARPKITSLKFINDDDMALLLTGTADGCVRIFRDYESPKPHLVTAWRALPQLVPSTHAESGLICEWQQVRGRLIAGGNAKDLKVWDGSTEVCTQDIATRSNSCVTSLTSDQVMGDVVVAGFGDGAVRVYDLREAPRQAMVQAWKGGPHRSWVKNVHMQRGGNRELVSGSVTGEVCLWDIRQSRELRVVQAHQGGLTSIAVHEHAPVFATGSEAGIIKVWNMFDDEPISRFRNTAASRAAYAREGAIHPVLSMQFHPHEMVLGVGAADAKLNIYHCQA